MANKAIALGSHRELNSLRKEVSRLTGICQNLTDLLDSIKSASPAGSPAEKLIREFEEWEKSKQMEEVHA